MSHCPTIAEVADKLGVTQDALIAKITELRDAGELVSVLWDEILPEHDLAPDDLPTIRAAMGK